VLLDKAPLTGPDGDSSCTKPPVFIITTKGKEFTLELLQQAGLGSIPIDHVYGFGSGKKVDILKELLTKYQGDR